MAAQRTWITRVLAVLAALVVTSCATFEKSDVSRADCTSNADCVVKFRSSTARLSGVARTSGLSSFV